MAEPFLNPPQSGTQLRAPQLNEGTDILGNVAGNDPSLVGQLAQLLMKLREPAGLAALGVGLKPMAPAVYKGFQEGFGSVPGFSIYNLTRSVGPEHVKDSTLSAQTLQKLGYRLPIPPPEGRQ